MKKVVKDKARKILDEFEERQRRAVATSMYKATQECWYHSGAVLTSQEIKDIIMVLEAVTK